MQYDNQTSYAKHRGISQVRVSQLIRDCKIPKSCLKIISGKQMIIRDKADEALRDNLNPIYVQKEMAKRAKNQDKKTKQEKKDTILDTCRQALRRTEAKEIDGVDIFEAAPFLPLLSYILNLFELNPELVKQELSEDEEDVILTFPEVAEIDQQSYWTTILSISHLDNN